MTERRIAPLPGPRSMWSGNEIQISLWQVKIHPTAPNRGVSRAQPLPSPSPVLATRMLCPRSARAAPSRAALSAAQALRLLDQWFRSFSLTSYFDFLNALEDTLPEAFRHGGVLEIFGHLFAVFRGPFQKFDELLSFGRILLLLINQSPSCTR